MIHEITYTQANYIRDTSVSGTDDESGGTGPGSCVTYERRTLLFISDITYSYELLSVYKSPPTLPENLYTIPKFRVETKPTEKTRGSNIRKSFVNKTDKTHLP